MKTIIVFDRFRVDARSKRKEKIGGFDENDTKTYSCRRALLSCLRTGVDYHRLIDDDTTEELLTPLLRQLSVWCECGIKTNKKFTEIIEFFSSILLTGYKKSPEKNKKLLLFILHLKNCSLEESQ